MGTGQDYGRPGWGRARPRACGEPGFGGERPETASWPGLQARREGNGQPGFVVGRVDEGLQAQPVHEGVTLMAMLLFTSHWGSRDPAAKVNHTRPPSWLGSIWG